jgi:MoxR-like ATPase
MAAEPRRDINEGRDPNGAVVLIDEIDKAEPDVPGGLLVPLGSFRFRVAETGTEVASGEGSSKDVRRLVILTSNNDRELAWPFVRRCVVFRLVPPKRTELIEIAERHLRSEGHEVSSDERKVLETLADRIEAFRSEADATNTHPPSTAEYLDAVRAALELKTKLTPDDWAFIERLLLAKEA